MPVIFRNESSPDCKTDFEQAQTPPPPPLLNEILSPSSDTTDSKLGWDTYWDKLESNVLGIGPS